MADDLLTHEQAMAEVSAFVPRASRGRLRLGDGAWARWLRHAPLDGPGRHEDQGFRGWGNCPWLYVQRQSDREQVWIERVKDE